MQADQNMTQIRISSGEDNDTIRSIHLYAFPEDERLLVSRLAVNLQNDHTTPPVLSLIARHAGENVGHIAFSPVTIDNHEDITAYILAPLGVRPEFQRQGIGRQLIEFGKRELLRQGVKVLLVYGDPEYYTRFGFNADTATRFIPPYPLQYPFGWMALNLDEYGVSGFPARIRVAASLNDPTLW